MNLKLHRWWNYKVPLMLAIAYQELLLFEGSFMLSRLLVTLGMFLLATFGIGSFAHILNDFFDREQDFRSQAETTMKIQLHNAGLLRPFFIEHERVMTHVTIVSKFVLTAFLAIAPWFWLKPSVVVCALLVVEFLLFFAYSAPPLRLKERGALGLVTDALYAFVVPMIVTSLVFADFSGRLPDSSWLVALGVWSLILGIRSIIVHQILDLDRDRLTGVSTFVAIRGIPTSLRLRNALVYIEAAAFLAFLSRGTEPILTLIFAADALWTMMLSAETSRVSLATSLEFSLDQFQRRRYAAIVLLVLLAKSPSIGIAAFTVIHLLSSAVGQRLEHGHWGYRPHPTQVNSRP